MSDADKKRSGDNGRQNGYSKKAKYYQKQSGSGAAIPAGTPAGGVLVTCETHFELKAAREALTLIEEHFDKLKSHAQPSYKESKEKISKDISALIAQEVEDLKDRKQHRFKIHNVDVKGCTFIIFPDEAGPSPLDVVLSILREAQQTKILRARNCHRLLPLSHACYCDVEHIKELAPKALEGHFPSGEGAACIPFSVEYEHRSADKFDRMEIINIFANLIDSPPHKVDLGSPQKTVLVQLTRNACGLGVVTHYKELAKYNIRKLTEVAEEGTETVKKVSNKGTKKVVETDTQPKDTAIEEKGS
ncbi:hypothetical protein CEUSTIGMA_g7439.t1 [Chlamydomonas eustigma]|uniref:THUMP domain-containing protein n=1 Tax=Chlamydomonas eustigma TaxID=1157962 RepID=A0A250XAT8_9CHLO|nr:hypothetical protein CEUSTIGMA_g7439.t1 [Chlamydomonas eustigma]|eukprot:GAX79999.1 hypothetical protein CEUSTIGMA_g7439.t1 [Chlamydomonas eustigma]